jgi:hypothetical protein
MTAGTSPPACEQRSWTHCRGTESPNRLNNESEHILRKIVLGLVAAAAIGTPLALAAPANADVAGTIDTTTYSDGEYHHPYKG